MGKCYILMLFYVLLSEAFMFNLYSQDQPVIEVYGTLNSELETLKNAQIKIKEDNKQWLNIKFNKRNGEFDLVLPLGHTFLFNFKQEGTIEKTISFNTNVPADYERVEFDPFFFIVKLEPYTDSPEIDTLFYNEPVGKIFFNEEFIKFDYDRSYNMYVKNKIKRVKEELLLAQSKTEEPERLLISSNESVIDSINALDNLVRQESDTLIEKEEVAEIISIKDTIRIDTAELIAQTNVEIEIKKEEKEHITEPVNENMAEAVDVKVSVTDKVQTTRVEESVMLAKSQEDVKRPDPQPVAIGLSNGKKTEFKQLENVHITSIYITKSRKTIIYSMYQYSNGVTRYYKQQPLTNDSISISKNIFTKSVR